MIQLSLRKSPPSSTLETIKEAITNYSQENELGLDPKYVEIIVVSIFARREELRKVLTQLVFRQSVDTHLVDYNYNIELCIASDTCSKVNEPMMVLELFLRGSEGKKLERIVVEMNLEETRAFVGNLKDIEKEMVAAQALT
eukprot:CAMPEP_0170545660 /NCGR_PEP_ID=MMETSP0211-20121228/4026_1 /TAXON_ID=311385 /ORGANISM="Pseudokeronopsis sp., Strain OXSARD2" /LENGTH=140 /DNA_ID=CAMNT_0010849679 /DNA_START=126 /DNA_END=543 /DNA_ORIENTATION=+